MFEVNMLFSLHLKYEVHVRTKQVQTTSVFQRNILIGSSPWAS